MTGIPVQLVWFKRDLRTADHSPLAEAAARGLVLPLYLVEPGLWLQPDASGRQWAFVREALCDLQAELGREFENIHRACDGLREVEVQCGAGCRIGHDYPAPIVDHLAGARLARQRMQAVRRAPGARDESRAILDRHGSRKRRERPRAKSANHEKLNGEG
jgi:deoxyribodipyrimidine photolyase